MKNSRRIKVGVIGAGKIVSNLHLPLLSQIKNVEIEFIADINTPSRLARVYNAKAIEVLNDFNDFPDVDLVVLATPVGVRTKYIKEFSKRNTPIFSEKPFAPDLETHKNWISGCPLISCNYMRRMFSSTVHIRNILNSGIFGNLKNVKVFEGGIVKGTNKPQGHYQNDKSLAGGGILFERGSHTLSQLTYWFKDDMLKCSDASVVIQNQLDVDVKASFIVDDPNNTIIDYHISQVRPVGNIAIFEFNDAVISFDHTDASAKLQVTSTREKNDKTFYFEHNNNKAITINEGHFLKLMNFINGVLEGRSMNTRYETSLDTTRLIEEIYKIGKEW